MLCQDPGQKAELRFRNLLKYYFRKSQLVTMVDVVYYRTKAKYLNYTHYTQNACTKMCTT